MQSELPKVLHKIAGRPMLAYSLDAAARATGRKPVVVVGYQAEKVKQAAAGAADYVYQRQQLGTAHAVQQAEALLKDRAPYVLVIHADMPMLTAATLRRLLAAQQTNAGPMTIVTIVSDNARGFGRIVRNEQNQIREIVEEADASPEQLAICELNAGIYCFSADWLWNALKRVKLSKKGEYYLTDLVKIAVDDGLTVQTIQLDDPAEAMGVNTREHLAEAEAILLRRKSQLAEDQDMIRSPEQNIS